MSVLIKDMEFPECCYACALNLWHTECSYTGHEFHDMFGEDIDPSKERHPDCPLIEVPKHGRLIDADCCNGYFYEHMSDDMMIAAMNAINEMPTIIQADKEEYKCESCVYNPPSSCDGKPCTQCDTRNPLTNCYIQAEEGE